MPWYPYTPIPRHPFDADIDCGGADNTAGYTLVGDFDGDGVQEIAVQISGRGSPQNIFWAMKRADDRFINMNPTGHPLGADIDFTKLDIPTDWGVVGDFDGDGTDELVLHIARPGTEGNDLWAIKRDPASGAWLHMHQTGHPLEADIDCSALDIAVKFAVAGDFDGDGTDELVLALDRPGTEGNDLWAMKRDPASGAWLHMHQTGHPLEADIDCSESDVPTRFAVAGDFDADGTDELVLGIDMGRIQGNSLWAMKRDAGSGAWLHMDAGSYSYDADIELSTSRMPVRALDVGRFSNDERDVLLALPEWAGTLGNDLWAVERITDFPSILTGTGTLFTSNPGAPGPFPAPVTIAVLVASNRRSAKIMSMTPITTTFATPFGMNTAKMTLVRAGVLQIDRANGTANVTVVLNIANSLGPVYELAVPLSTETSLVTPRASGARYNSTSGAIALVGQGTLEGPPPLGGATATLLISGTFSPPW
ncbi:hypothetical protein [Streptomyces sp. NPDC001410]|uniref:hypothetical protein n=1 Tax=Streptomyces sp. NPDC001410 TaxID=3364574 RepID=UPI0036BCF379